MKTTFADDQFENSRIPSIITISKDDDIKFIPDFRHEAAKDILCAMITNAGGTYGPEDKEGLCRTAIEVADELIKQLKK